MVGFAVAAAFAMSAWMVATPGFPDAASSGPTVQAVDYAEKTLSPPIHLPAARAYRVWPTIIRPLRDGRLVLMAGVWKRGNGSIPNPRMTKMMFVSADQGRLDSAPGNRRSLLDGQHGKDLDQAPDPRHQVLSSRHATARR